ncbi:MAG: phenylacetate-CoA oxygenase subunit PaaJ [Gemmatimonadaceae bacterium]|nr:phenylacetate-CoA oxygenase subunit PaaJ [Chitinophagaceae bacterium]
MVSTSTISKEYVYGLLAEVVDPEVPVLSIIDLGIVREVFISDDKTEIVITPTYSGCPAMQRIEWDIKTALLEKGITNASVKTILSPAWTTDWMTKEGKEKLKAYGIAPPNPTASVCSTDLFAAAEAVQCPHCSSYHTIRVSEFGSTACKSLFKCSDCQEPFDYFKCH